MARKFKQCGAKDLDLTEVWAYHQIKKGWTNARPPPRSKQRATQSPSTFSQQCCPTSACRMNSTRWRGCPSRHRKRPLCLGELLRASKQTLHIDRARPTETQFLRRKNAPPGQAVLVDYFCNGTPHSAVKATRNALGLPDDFTGTVAGGDLAIFRANGAEIFKPAVIKRLQRALKRAGFDPDLHSGTACAKAERRISSMPASSCNISCAGGRGPKAAPHCAFTAMSLLLLGLAGPSGPPMAHAQDRASNPTCWTSIKSSWQFVIGPRLHRVRPSSPRLRIVWV